MKNFSMTQIEQAFTDSFARMDLVKEMLDREFNVLNLGSKSVGVVVGGLVRVIVEFNTLNDTKVIITKDNGTLEPFSMSYSDVLTLERDLKISINSVK